MKFHVVKLLTLFLLCCLSATVNAQQEAPNNSIQKEMERMMEEMFQSFGGDVQMLFDTSSMKNFGESLGLGDDFKLDRDEFLDMTDLLLQSLKDMDEQEMQQLQETLKNLGGFMMPFGKKEDAYPTPEEDRIDNYEKPKSKSKRKTQRI